MNTWLVMIKSVFPFCFAHISLIQLLPLLFSAPRALWSCVVLIRQRNRPFKRVELAKKKHSTTTSTEQEKRVYIFSFRGIVHALLVHSRKKYKSELANWGVFSRLSERSVDNFFFCFFSVRDFVIQSFRVDRRGLCVVGRAFFFLLSRISRLNYLCVECQSNVSLGFECIAGELVRENRNQSVVYLASSVCWKKKSIDGIFHDRLDISFLKLRLLRRFCGIISVRNIWLKWRQPRRSWSCGFGDVDVMVIKRIII